MHQKLARLCSKDIEQIPHHELLIATHGLAIELMISCALPPDITNSWQPFLVKQGEDGREYKIFRGLIDIYILKAPLQMALNEILIACETSNEIAKAVRLPDFAREVQNFAVIEKLESKTRIVIQGTMGLSKFQGAMGIFFTKNFPDFQLPLGLDTEVYKKPMKYAKRGFRMATTA